MTDTNFDSRLAEHAKAIHRMQIEGRTITQMAATMGVPARAGSSGWLWEGV